MPSTQNFVPIEDIKNNLVFLKDGGAAMVLTTTAVNFALLFETEQIAIIQSFAGLLNSLSFPIQILVISKRLDVSSYLTTLDKALKKQTNPKLITLTSHYRRFVENLIKEKDVLDKQFYICINIASFELGLTKMNINDRSSKAGIILAPRRDHLTRQLTRIGLKARQLTTVELIKLYYDLYNPALNGNAGLTAVTNNTPASLPLNPPPSTKPAPQPISPPITISRLQPSAPPPKPQPSQLPPLPSLHPPQPIVNYRLSAPFVVEELTDDIRP